MLKMYLAYGTNEKKRKETGGVISDYGITLTPVSPVFHNNLHIYTQ